MKLFISGMLLLFIQFNLQISGASGLEYQFQIYSPEAVEIPQKIKTESPLLVTAYVDLKNSCESAGTYTYEIKDNNIVISAYKRIADSDLCVQRYLKNVKLIYEIDAAFAVDTYAVYFKDDLGNLQYSGAVKVSDESN